ncbi:MAG TPA: Ig-like domain-containing protein, partial [Gemmataceae bacterium]|nr:Ig-like domain-containing protein [Gemmataceae bacterium]
SSLTMALGQGDYYLVVTGAGYVPAALTDAGLLDSQSVFDPNAPHPFGGFSTGDYVLNLSVLADNTPPEVKSVALADGTALADRAVLAGPPTGFAVTFTEPVNLADQAQQAFQQNTDTKLPFVYVVGASGTFYPRLTDSTGNSVRFQMYDALPNGVYDLHLSGPGGLTDLAGNPLVGNRESGDYVVTFMVNGPPRGSPNNPLSWVVQDQRNIGILFPAELQQGVTLQRPPVAGAINPVGAIEAYQIQVLQNTRYTFTLSSTSLPPGIRLTITNASGIPQPSSALKTRQGIAVRAVLVAGSYTIHVSGWSAQAGFSIKIDIDSAFEPAPPLTVGAAPAVPLRGLTGVLPPPPGIVPVTPTPTSVGTPVVAKPSFIAVVSPPSGRGQDTNPVNVPADVLLGLGAGQLGGIEGANANAALAKLDVYDRVIGLGPDASFAQLVVQLPILTQASSSGLSDDPAAAALAGSVVQDLMRRLSKINWATIAELLQQVGDWSMDHMLPTPAGDGDGQSGSDAPSAPEMPDISCWPGDDTSVSFTDAGTQAFVFAAALAVVRLDRERQPSKPKRTMRLEM